MKKWIGLFGPLFLIFFLTGFALKSPKTVSVKLPESQRVTKKLLVNHPQPVPEPDTEEILPPFLGSNYMGFREALAFSESRGDYFTINTLGYLGKYQFGVSTLNLLGIYNAVQFLNTPELQEEAFATNLSRNKWILRKDIKRFVGKKIDGVEVTESGILAAAHLAGAGNVKRYLRSWGAVDVQDAYGTTIRRYLSKFSGFDTSNILAERNPRIL
ncbi:hypothetical protein SAMN04490243_1644 [Robiginitalea myxolifaciens]|uniref:Peptidoglycan-binding protein LysM n=1 Tax=Robiginitalea myxolifaciens TaxID=400055 RepID=A0A1I6GRP5_9FLAO|nr:hypothetical protein [Robiginitalea myxolifaciens]SFR44884.1 hypothetical protein SAMN04490243_1644 [Robiginitalea myxolifaciens]